MTGIIDELNILQIYQIHPKELSTNYLQIRISQGLIISVFSSVGMCSFVQNN